MKIISLLIAEAKSVVLVFLFNKLNRIGHICDFSERISNVFFSEQITYEFGLPEIIKSKQGKTIEPKALNNI